MTDVDHPVPLSAAAARACTVAYGHAVVTAVDRALARRGASVYDADEPLLEATDAAPHPAVVGALAALPYVVRDELRALISYAWLGPDDVDVVGDDYRDALRTLHETITARLDALDRWLVDHPIVVPIDRPTEENT